MTEPTFRCPKCEAEIPLTESIAAPLVASMKREYEQKIRQHDEQVAVREKALREQREALEAGRARFDEELKQRVDAERAAISAAEQKRARAALEDEIARARQDKSDADALLKERDAKLAEAHKNELELRRERQALIQEKERFELDKQRALDAERAQIRETVQKEADAQSSLKLAEKEKTIGDLRQQLQDAVRKAEQGSQQLQGEVQELELESLLRLKFPRDTIEPVAKGEHGGDVVHRVIGPLGQIAGTILWEAKRTRNWSDLWLGKLRDDQRAAHADVAVIVSQALPRGCETFDLCDGVWVTSPRCAIPVAIVLRQWIVDLGSARASREGQQGKMELVYQYLTGPRFRQRVEAIVEKFSEMQEDLEKERRNMTRTWAKREEQIRGVIESTAGMYGDLQGIAGRTLQQIEGLEMKQIEDEGGAA